MKAEPVQKEKGYWHYGCCSGFGLPLLLILIGGYWLASSMEWIPKNIPFWPVIILVIGVYWLISRLLRGRCCG